MELTVTGSREGENRPAVWRQLYDYMQHRCCANKKNCSSECILAEVQGLLITLGEAWQGTNPRPSRGDNSRRRLGHPAAANRKRRLASLELLIAALYTYTWHTSTVIARNSLLKLCFSSAPLLVLCRNRCSPCLKPDLVPQRSGVPKGGQMPNRVESFAVSNVGALFSSFAA